ncbi:MAG: TonB-dependent receptor, partial [Deltaproteobacteria bacterium]|nr:TonB-dependent receptor [Deltaproteobacteria bacterium]
EPVPGSPAPPVPEAFLLGYSGDDDADATTLYAFELGHRWQINDDVNLDLSYFFNRYNGLLSAEDQGATGNDGKDPYSLAVFDLAPPGGAALAGACLCNPYLDPVSGKVGYASLGFDPSDYMVGTTLLSDGNNEESTGIEATLNWAVSKSWAMGFGYSLISRDVIRGDDSDEDNAPQHQFNVSSNLNLPYNLEFDTYAYYVDEIPSLDVDSYVRLDMRLGWKPKENLEISLQGQNLLESSHEEWAGVFESGESSRRAGYLKLTYQF